MSYFSDLAIVTVSELESQWAETFVGCNYEEVMEILDSALADPERGLFAGQAYALLDNLMADEGVWAEDPDAYFYSLRGLYDLGEFDNNEHWLVSITFS